LNGIIGSSRALSARWIIGPDRARHGDDDAPPAHVGHDGAFGSIARAAPRRTSPTPTMNVSGSTMNARIGRLRSRSSAKPRPA
jgi:hypothetical protein